MKPTKKRLRLKKLVEFDGESEGMELSKVEQEYGADEIQVLEGLEAVRSVQVCTSVQQDREDFTTLFTKS